MGLLDRVKANQGALDGDGSDLNTATPAAAAGSPAPAASNGHANGHTNAPVVAAAASPAAPARMSAPAAAAVANPSGRPQTAAGAPGGGQPGGGGLSGRVGTGKTQTTSSELSPAFTAIKAAVHTALLDRYADEIDVTDRHGVKDKISELIDEHIRVRALTVTRTDRERLVEALLNDVLGLGPLEPLVNDPEISEIMINHPKQIYIERKGTPMLSNVTFESNKQLMLVIDRIVSSIGRRVDESSPMVDARLKDGSRVNVIIPPLALKGPCMTIRKFAREKLGPDDLIRFGTATPEMMHFLQSAVRSRLNVLVSGGTGSGKTTLLNILSSFIPGDERIITCEDAAELQLQQDHVITLESRPPNVEGKGAVHIRDLVRNCLRMRPDRIIVGECRGGEALDMLQAMNTGHDGSMSTLHANNAHDALNRLETLVLMAGTELPSRAIREQVSSAINLIVQQQRLRGGSRKIVSIAEITGIENGEVRYQELFVYKQVGVSDDGKAIGYHTPTGVKPMNFEHFKASGEELPDSMFMPVQEPPVDQLY